MMIKMTEQNSVAELDPFVGARDLLIIGAGTVRVLKDIGEGFYPMTDEAGDIIEISSEDGVIYNGKIENTRGEVRYAIQLIDGIAEWRVV